MVSPDVVLLAAHCVDVNVDIAPAHQFVLKTGEVKVRFDNAAGLPPGAPSPFVKFSIDASNVFVHPNWVAGLNYVSYWDVAAIRLPHHVGLGLAQPMRIATTHPVKSPAEADPQSLAQCYAAAPEDPGVCRWHGHLLSFGGYGETSPGLALPVGEQPRFASAVVNYIGRPNYPGTQYQGSLAEGDLVHIVNPATGSQTLAGDSGGPDFVGPFPPFTTDIFLKDDPLVAVPTVVGVHATRGAVDGRPNGGFFFARLTAPSTKAFLAQFQDHDSDGVPDYSDPCVALFGSHADGDGDGVGAGCDNCVSASNPDQADQDEDGIGDQCDPCAVNDFTSPDADSDGLPDVCDDCPCSPTEKDPFADGDKDGVCPCNPTLLGCGTVCSKTPGDNCPNTPNATQTNCNLDAELAAGAVLPGDSGTLVLGDACDEVPCADAQAEPEGLKVSFAADGACQPGPLVTKSCPILVDTSVKWRGIVAGPSSGSAGVTELAHCPCEFPHATPAQRLLNCVSFPVVGTPRCVIGQAEAFPSKTGATSPSAFMAITTTVPGGGPGQVYSPKTARNVEYKSAYAYSASPLVTTRWWFEQDLVQFGVSFTAPPGGVTKASDLKPIADALDGVGWASTRALGGLALAGAKADLAARYFAQDLNPRFGMTFFSLGLVQMPSVAYLDFPLCPKCPFPDPPGWIAPSPTEVLVVLGALAGPGPAKNVAVAVGSELSAPTRATLASLGVTRSVVSASEPSDALRAQGISTRGVLLDSESLVPVGDVLETPTGLAFSTRDVCPPARPECDVVRSRSVRAMSGRRSELYVVGRENGIERLITLDLIGGAVLDTPLSGIDAGGKERSLAYRMADDSLYLLDAIAGQKGSEFRLVRIKRDGAASEVSRFAAKGDADATSAFVSVTAEGLLLLALSGPSANGHSLYVLFDPSAASGGSNQVVAWTVDPEPGRLLLAAEGRQSSAIAVAKRSPTGDIIFSNIPRAAFQQGAKPIGALAGLLQ